MKIKAEKNDKIIEFVINYSYGHTGSEIRFVEKILNINTVTIIEKLNNILDKELIVGYTAEGKPLTKKAYNKRLEKAEAQIASGKFISQEELERESENW